MQVFTTRLPNIVQPILLGNQFHRKPIVLQDRATRWRKQARFTNLSSQARLRMEWMIFYETVGNHNAYQTAKHFAIAPKTFYKWHRRFDNGQLRNLEDQSKVPKHKRLWQVSLVEELRIKKLRKAHLCYGRKKLHKLYQNEHGQTISLWKIQKVIVKHGLYPDPKKHDRVSVTRTKARPKPKRRIQDLVIEPGLWFLVHLDTIVLYWGSLKRYIVTAIDHQGKFAYARMYTNKSSRSAKDFLYRLKFVIDAPIINIQTDNGSEFYAGFDEALEALQATHWFSRPRTPKDNAMVERFNETLQYEWLNDGQFTTNPTKFNQALTDWLIEYNFHRPHQALDYQTPIEYIERILQASNQNLLPMWSFRTPH